jgi:hypothetical protein
MVDECQMDDGTNAKQMVNKYQTDGGRMPNRLWTNVKRMIGGMPNGWCDKWDGKSK